jgi:hypothetical protein
MYPGGIGVVTQSGWQTAFGGYSMDQVWLKYNTEDMNFLRENLGISLLMVFYLLVLIPSLLLAVFGTLIQLKLIPVELPPSLSPYWSFRPLVLALLVVAGLVLLAVQLFTGFSLENVTKRHADAKALRAQPEQNQGNWTAEDHQRYAMDAGKEYGHYNLHRSAWLRLAFVLQFVALFGAALEYWVARRGALPSPRIDLHT